MQTDSSIISEEDILNEPISEKKIVMARHLFDSLENQVQLADRKVQAIFGLNAFLVAAISLQSQQKLNDVMATGFKFNLVLDLILKAVFLGCACMATWSAVKALSPRGQSKGKIKTAKKPMFYFGNIHSQHVQQFTKSFINLDDEGTIKELLDSSHIISGILHLKYKFLRRSTSFISAALLIWVIMQVNKFLI
jgi:hypothetical protein